jgi:nucleoside-diphosphate-sugar epimerase
MKVLILGTGHVGKALAKKLKAAGHTVAGTTTTPAKVDDLKNVLDEVHVLKGNETDKVIAAAQGCDAIVVTVAPNVKNTRTIEERHVHYNDVLVKSNASAAAACPRVVFCSSFSVYGDGGAGTAPITEETPTGNHEEPSSKYYQLAEQEILKTGKSCALRFPDMYGAPGDLTYTERCKLVHDFFGGKTVFGEDSPLYAIHFEDVVEAIYHTLTNNLVGIYNVCDNDNVPHTNKEVFDALCEEAGLSPFEYLDQIKAPNRKISAEKLYATGYKVKHGDPNAEAVARFKAKKA